MLHCVFAGILILMPVGMSPLLLAGSPRTLLLPLQPVAPAPFGPGRVLFPGTGHTFRAILPGVVDTVVPVAVSAGAVVLVRYLVVNCVCS
ncbi:hypothetical protein N657DRAFT_646149 [Parathielavia appendiculata]|uniref:Secreted protein n=1 Tax=Parathielavia appendiculata TaxID=2587402 RepID=A0AAN6Z3D3_9PEZI|nr:hypothetical protein N657DRAFT_646149 [Parathielavia appendiculata]